MVLIQGDLRSSSGVGSAWLVQLLLSTRLRAIRRWMENVTPWRSCVSGKSRIGNAVDTLLESDTRRPNHWLTIAPSLGSRSAALSLHSFVDTKVMGN
jgi:hypothetical protein